MIFESEIGPRLVWGEEQHSPKQSCSIVWGDYALPLRRAPLISISMRVDIFLQKRRNRLYWRFLIFYAIREYLRVCSGFSQQVRPDRKQNCKRACDKQRSDQPVAD